MVFLARTPLVARITIYPSFTDGYESNHPGILSSHSLDKADFQSPIDLTSRHRQTSDSRKRSESAGRVSSGQQAKSGLRFANETDGHDAEYGGADHCLRKKISEKRKISRPPKWRRSRRKDGFEWSISRRGITEDSAPLYEYTASLTIASVESDNALPTVMVDRRVKISKYSNIAPTSTEITKKHSVSNKDKNFDNFDMFDKALLASNLLSLLDGSRSKPAVTKLNSSGYTVEAIVTRIRWI